LEKRISASKEVTHIEEIRKRRKENGKKTSREPAVDLSEIFFTSTRTPAM